MNLDGLPRVGSQRRTAAQLSAKFGVTRVKHSSLAAELGVVTDAGVVRRLGCTSRSLAALAVVILLTSCRDASVPERVLAGYIRSVREHRCDAAMNFLSARTRHAIESLVERPQHPHAPVPIEHYYCYDLMFEKCKDGKMTLTIESGDIAEVSMPCGRTQESILPGFTSMFLKYEPRVTRLVRESGEWRVELPIPIRIVELRERGERARDAAKQEMERRRRLN